MKGLPLSHYVIKLLVSSGLLVTLWIRYDNYFTDQSIVIGIKFPDQTFLENVHVVDKYNLRDALYMYYMFVVIAWVPCAIFNVINAWFVWESPLVVMEYLQVLAMMPKVVSLVVYFSYVTVNYYQLALDCVLLWSLFKIVRLDDYEPL